jgi:alpha-galactosidase
MRNSGRAVIVLAGLAVSTAAVVVSGLPAAHALPNGLATAPPMGWNDWNAFGCNVNEQLVEQTADVFVSAGMRDAGYTYVNIDDCWLTRNRDTNGNLVPDPAKFPHGISGVASYVHGKGLKLGIYEDAGTATCAGYPGSLGHEQQDANLFASWGVDYLKYDNCNNTGVPAPQRYTAMRNALAATGRPILFSICDWGQEGPWNWGPGLGNLWRTTGDISDNYASMTGIFHSNVGLAPHSAPGAWNDPDMLEIGNGGMTAPEYRSEFSLWAEMAAPLLSGTDLRSASADTLAIYTNRDVIAVDQDPLGAQGRLVASASASNQHVLAKPLANGDVAVLLFNESGSAATFGTTATAAGVTPASTYTLTDLWAHTSRTTGGDISASVPAHGVVMYRVSGGGTAVHGGWSSYASTDAGFGQVDPYLRVAAAGTDTWTANDEYGALYRHAALTDGGTVTARVSAQANTSDWAKAGIMVRADVTTRSAGYVALAATPGHGYALQWDSTGDGYLDSSITAGATTYPGWLRLARSGSTFTGYYSADGAIWTQVGQATVPGVVASEDAGVFATSHHAGSRGQVDFSDFALNAAPTAGHTYTLINGASGKVVDLYDNQTADSTPVIQWTANGGRNQQWTLNDAGGGAFTLTTPVSGKCMDVSGPSTADNAPVIEFTCHGATNQQWRLAAVGAAYELVSVYSGKCLDNPNGSTADGTQLIQYTCHGATNQQWWFQQVS